MYVDRNIYVHSWIMKVWTIKFQAKFDKYSVNLTPRLPPTIQESFAFLTVHFIV